MPGSIVQPELRFELQIVLGHPVNVAQQASSMSHDGDIFILNLDERSRSTISRAIRSPSERLHRRQICIESTGLGLGEKLYEVLSRR
ncbi:polysaccharide biosynthesis protein [Paraburkholderia azotifigens]|uniref:polysaccharide biosynthesis protein n=1 Tax=Paraburkholderia azotifigens TaxID=2057004 RepID=UPI003CCC4C66